MADFSQFLLVSDYDHTMTDHTGQIPQANLDAISYFTSHGGMFTICTGRSIPASRYTFDHIPLNAPLLFCNGAGCCDLATESLFFCHPLPEETEDLMAWCLKEFPDLRLEVHCLDKHYVFNADAHRNAALTRRKTSFEEVADFTVIPHPWVKFSLYSRNGDVTTMALDSERGLYFKEAAAKTAEKAGAGFVVTHSMPGLIEVQVAGSSKGLAARKLAGMLNRPILVCVGDAPNDVPMLELADLPFLASDCDPRMQNTPYRKVAPSYEGTVADVIRILEEM